MKKVAILGSGAWGTTLGQVMCDSGQHLPDWFSQKPYLAHYSAGVQVLSFGINKFDLSRM